jgi:hypothetical protein
VTGGRQAAERIVRSECRARTASQFDTWPGTAIAQLVRPRWLQPQRL